jgi:hypothetical protein
MSENDHTPEEWTAGLTTGEAELFREAQSEGTTTQGADASVEMSSQSDGTTNAGESNADEAYQHPDDYSGAWNRRTARPSRLIALVVVGILIIVGLIIFAKPSSTPVPTMASSPMCTNYANFILGNTKLKALEADTSATGPTPTQQKDITVALGKMPVELRAASAVATPKVAKEFNALILSMGAVVEAPSSTSVTKRAALDAAEQADFKIVVKSANKICYGV